MSNHPIENLLQRLDKVKARGPGKWSARCPAHDDKGPSLAVKELDDGRVLIHCFAQCGAVEILHSVGLDFVDLYPSNVEGNFRPKARKSFNASDVLNALAMEILIAWNFAKALANGVILTDAERARLLTCASRLQRGLELTNG